MKTVHLQARFSPEVSRLIKDAAKSLGLNQSEFIRIAATERAKKEMRGNKNA